MEKPKLEFFSLSKLYCKFEFYFGTLQSLYTFYSAIELKETPFFHTIKKQAVITPTGAQELLRKDGIDTTLDEAGAILRVYLNWADIIVTNFLQNEEDSRPVCQGQYRRAG
ncbi:MAG: hypothetical protein WCF67_06445 [Chitinophagaceae bacterium]